MSEETEIARTAPRVERLQQLMEEWSLIWAEYGHVVSRLDFVTKEIKRLARQEFHENEADLIESDDVVVKISKPYQRTSYDRERVDLWLLWNEDHAEDFAEFRKVTNVSARVSINLKMKEG